MRPDSKGLKLFGSRFCPGRVMTTVQVSGDSQTSLGSGGANEAEYLWVGIERFAGPVLRNLGEETVLDRVPLRGTGRIVGNGEC